MAMGDIQFYDISTAQQNGAKRALVAAGATTINPGEPISRTPATANTIAMVTAAPSIGTHYFQGIATSTSTQTASAAGYVDYLPYQPGVIYLAKPNAAITTQSAYDALVGKRVLMDLTSGSYTLLASDNALFGFVIMPLDIARYPGKIAFTVRSAATDLGNTAQ